MSPKEKCSRGTLGELEEVSVTKGCNKEVHIDYTDMLSFFISLINIVKKRGR